MTTALRSHFDSGAVCRRLLDAERSRFLRLAPAGEHASSRRYGEDGPVLESESTVPAALTIEAMQRRPSGSAQS
ncbi:MAG: hypothetical protein H0W48_05990 [Methylibium sp.]|nr:hypothetical protein [Methylibium sp.]